MRLILTGMLALCGNLIAQEVSLAYDKAAQAENHKRRIEELKKAADAGDASACNTYGLYCIYESNKRAEGVKYLEKAGSLGLADAFCEIGICYEIGLGVDKSFAKAIGYISASVEKGSALGNERMVFTSRWEHRELR